MQVLTCLTGHDGYVGDVKKVPTASDSATGNGNVSVSTLISIDGDRCVKLWSLSIDNNNGDTAGTTRF